MYLCTMYLCTYVLMYHVLMYLCTMYSCTYVLCITISPSVNMVHPYLMHGKHSVLLQQEKMVAIFLTVDVEIDFESSESINGVGLEL